MENCFIICELDSWPWNCGSEFIFNNCLFGGVTLTKNADPDKYLYSSSGIGFDNHIQFF